MRHSFFQKIIFSAIAFGIVALPVMLFAQKKDFGLTNTATQAGFSDKAVSPSDFVGDIIGIVLGFTGIVFFGLMVYGGMIWLTARGNDERVEKARTIITSAIIGLTVVLIAYGVTKLALSLYKIPSPPQNSGSSASLPPGSP